MPAAQAPSRQVHLPKSGISSSSTNHSHTCPAVSDFVGNDIGQGAVTSQQRRLLQKGGRRAEVTVRHSSTDFGVQRTAAAGAARPAVSFAQRGHSQ